VGQPPDFETGVFEAQIQIQFLVRAERGSFSSELRIESSGAQGRFALIGDVATPRSAMVGDRPGCTAKVEGMHTGAEPARRRRFVFGRDEPAGDRDARGRWVRKNFRYASSQAGSATASSSRKTTNCPWASRNAALR